ncbi:MAG: response regulator transcription factor [Solirubrobacteraceae bacterium]|nr:response regulator transcription factor [Solirubrobacteraceae bacterium]
MSVKVFVVDSHAIYRRGLVASLELLERVDDVDQADGVRGAREHSALLDADVVILDASIAGGRDFIASVAQAGDAHVIACTSNGTEESVVDAVEAGAVGYLRKDTLTQDVLQAAIQAAECGAAIVPPDALGAVLRSSPEPSDEESPRLSDQRLTEREQRVLALIADGHLTRGVAEQLCYSERTVKNVLHDVVTKLNARSRSQAVAHAVRDGLI